MEATYAKKSWSGSGAEFIPFAAAAVPSALWSFGASAYLLAAKQYQATIIGRVTINGVPATYVTVRLFDLAASKGGKDIPKAEKELLDDYGQYQFFIWVFRGDKTLRVTATYGGKTEERTGITVSLQKRSSNVLPINFVTEELTTTAQTTKLP